MEKKIPFSIGYKKQIINGSVRVVTRNNYPVEIIKWDAKGRYPIVGLIENNYSQLAVSYLENGKEMAGEDSKTDLFIIGDWESNYVEDKKIIEDIIVYLEDYSGFDSGDEPYEEYCKRFDNYIKFMKGLLNKLHPDEIKKEK